MPRRDRFTKIYFRRDYQTAVCGAVIGVPRRLLDQVQFARIEADACKNCRRVYEWWYR